MRKIIIIIVVIVVAAIPGYYFVNKKIINSKLNEQLQAAIGRDQGLTEMILRTPSETISYRELFELCEKSVNGRNELLIELRGLYPDIQNKLRDSLADFLSLENELVRLRSLTSRKAMKLNTAAKYIEELRQSANNSYYLADMYTRKMNSEYEEGLKLKQEMERELAEFTYKYQMLLSKEGNLGKMMQSEGLRFLPIYSKYKSVNISE